MNMPQSVLTPPRRPGLSIGRRRPRAGGDPRSARWIPAFAGMTGNGKRGNKNVAVVPAQAEGHEERIPV